MPEHQHSQSSWRPLDGRPPQCGEPHRRGAGWLDESARRLTHSEYAVAQQLANEGHRVRSLPEHPGQGPIADLEVCGIAVEVKSFLSVAQRDARVPGPRSVFNKLVSAERQGTTVIIYARDSGLTAAAAKEGVASYAAQRRQGQLDRIRAVGDGFDMSWGRQLRLARRPDPPEPTPALIR